MSQHPKVQFFKIPLSDSEMISENSYIKFVNRDEKGIKSTRNVKLDEIKGIEMNSIWMLLMMLKLKL